MKKSDTILRILKYVHLLLITALFYVTWLWFRYGALTGIDRYGFRYNYFVAALFALIFFPFARTYNAYMVGARRIRNLVFAQSLAEFFALAIVYFGTAIAWNQWHDPLVFLALLIVFAAVNIGWSYLASDIYFKYNPPEKAVIIGATGDDFRQFAEIYDFPFTRQYSVDKCIENPADAGTLLEAVKGYGSVFSSGLNPELRDVLVKYCAETGTKGYFIPTVGDILLAGSYHMQNFSSPVMFLTRKQPRPEYLILKRAFDIAASLCGIIILSPFMLITALAIKMYDGGPVIYSHIRLTKNGKPFRIYKFRSMRVDAEADGRARLSTENDDRITPVGKFIRSCRFDELPQLFNILKGDMTIVGPRPERPELAAEIEKTLPEFPLRLQVTAGLTGYAQIYGKYCTEPREKLLFDLLYMNNMNIVTDLQLMFATVATLFDKESTHGVAR